MVLCVREQASEDGTVKASGFQLIDQFEQYLVLFILPDQLTGFFHDAFVYKLVGTLTHANEAMHADNNNGATQY
jgi:hypothetical protein